MLASACSVETSPAEQFCVVVQQNLLHLAARALDTSVLSTAVQAYRRAKLLPEALSVATDGDHKLPIHVALLSESYENTALLLKECREYYPEALQASSMGMYSRKSLLVLLLATCIYK